MINSKANETYKNLLKLKKDKSYLFLDNPKLIFEAEKAGYNIEYILKTDKVENLFDYEVIEFSESLFKTFSTTCASQGLIAVVKNKEQKLKKPSGNFLVLDGLQDPGNVGTIIRSALGANFLDIYLVDCVNILNEKLVRSSMGAIFKTNLMEVDKKQFVEFYNNNLKTYNLVCADMNGENLFESKEKDFLGIVLGNEGNGISEDIKKLCNKSIKIPMQNDLESLNVAIAGGIIMYYLTNSKN